ncbi:UAA transporter [Nadsonia fulvescens var. elongata DSM 6958]|uniref:UDP-galactose transporter homolog 1 n=1 Tax=Nadsonia fulvescens var. elongata DSM 6958 TaxID=857566 RepID=A0A1E3PH67_9ASCO|nr:UAA transporter [Nadsonia fulvescens var. elongata DSM 6958]
MTNTTIVSSSKGKGDSVKRRNLAGPIEPEMIKLTNESVISSSTTKKVSVDAVHHKIGPSLFKLLFCALGIYASFLTWAILQERISSPPSTSNIPALIAPVPINTIQSLFACAIGFAYLTYHRCTGHQDNLQANPALYPLFKSPQLLGWVTLVAISQSISSPLGYLALKHVDYLTLILFKSCKLIPVMLIHKILYGKSFARYKYTVVGLVTLGVLIFTLCQPKRASSKSANTESEDDTGSQSWGLLLLLAGSLLDGLTNSTQDQIFSKYRHFTGPHLMVLLNMISTLLTTVFLLNPFSSGSQLTTFFNHIQKYPTSLFDVLLFAVCGAMGQIFIFITLGSFGSLTLVMVTVTRKMMSMLLSVIWFGKVLAVGQWAGVGLVFGGVGLEAGMKLNEKK